MFIVDPNNPNTIRYFLICVRKDQPLKKLYNNVSLPFFKASNVPSNPDYLS